MARFLSHEWFEHVRLAQAEQEGGTPTEPAEARTAGEEPGLLLHQVVTGGPDGEVRYQVAIWENRATLREGATGDADMTFTTDYPTASAVARGELSTHTALLQGRIRVIGSPLRLGTQPETFADLDPVPARVRAETTYS